jgi:hypothetical protein
VHRNLPSEALSAARGRCRRGRVAVRLKQNGLRHYTDSARLTRNVRGKDVVMTQLHIYLGNDIPPDIECQVVSFLRVHWPWTFSGETG